MRQLTGVFLRYLMAVNTFKIEKYEKVLTESDILQFG